MSRFVHHASRRIAEVESEFAHARYIVAPALLWAVAIVAVVAVVVATVLQDTPATAPAQTASPAEVPVVPLGA